MPDPVQMLIDDHKKVKDLFQQFERADGGREKRKIVGEAIRKLRVHSALEEQVFYPAVRAVKEADDIMDEADEEHHMADILMDELESMTPRHSHFDAKFTVLAESVRHPGRRFVPFKHEIEFRHHEPTSCDEGQLSQMRAIIRAPLIATPRSSHGW